jgi:plastocyanin
MKNQIHSRLFQSGIAASFLMLGTMTHAATTLVSASRYAVTEGVAFTLGNTFSSDFVFNWTDPSGTPAPTFSGISDPTLVLSIGQTYTFQRITSSHPFAIMDTTATVFMAGTDGSYNRTTTDSAAITAATLPATPAGDFIAQPSPTQDLISWTPTQAGDFWYTCTVASHGGMTGKITVVPEPSGIALIASGLVFGILRRRRPSAVSRG